MEAEFLYLAGFGFKLAGNYPKALDFARRLLARTPMHEKNLINLTDLLILEGAAGEAKEALEMLVKHYPHNEKIPRLSDAIANASEVKA